MPMSREQVQELLDQMMLVDGPMMEFVVERVAEGLAQSLRENRTFSEEAMRDLMTRMTTWIGSRIMRQWADTEIPPTRLTVSLDVTVS